MALQPTVFYYSVSSQTRAQTIASELEELTGIEFDVARGAGYGVKPDKKEITFFVHLTR